MMVVVAGCFTACSSDNDDDDGDGGNSKSLIVGRWILTEAYDSNGETVKLRLEDDGEGLEFDEDGFFAYHYGGYTLGKTWQKIWRRADYTYTGTYTFDGSILSVKYSDENEIRRGPVKSLTKNKLKFENKDGSVVVFERFTK